MLQPGDQIDIWVVEKPLGQGGMGSVYRCHNRSAQRILAAVKVLDPSLNRVESAQARFIREAEILFALDHPNIVKVRNVRMDAELPYLEMEFVQGDNLEERIYEGRVELDDAVKLFRQAADALVYMHDRGIRHRDIKPSNMIVQDDGGLKLVDFGIATEQDGKTITESGQNFGSVSYAPPEWIDPNDLDPVKWDVYSLGVVYYELLTGRFGFPISGVGTSRQKALQVMIAKQNHPPLDPGPQFPVALRSLIRSMTRSAAADRMATSQEVLDRLENIDLEHIDPEHRFGDEPEHRPTSATWYPGMEDSSDTMIPEIEDLERVRQEIIEKGRIHSSPTTPEPPTPSMDESVDRSESETKPQPPPRGILPSKPPDAPIEEPAPSSKTPLVAGALLLLGGAAAAWWFTQEPPPPPVTTRAVEVVVAGIGAEVPVSVEVDGQVGTADGLVWSFGEVDFGSHSVVATVGEDCTPEATWCGVTETDFEVVEGEGVATAMVTVSAPVARPLMVSTPDVKKASARVGELVVEVGKEPVEVTWLLPGKHVVVVEVGTCEPGAAGCLPDCPSGCSSWSQEVVVDWEGGPIELEAPIEAPTLAILGIRGDPDGARVEDVVSSAGTAAKAAVSYGQFGSWLASNPTWQKDAAIDAGKADGNYLKGWEGATPPAGKSSQAIVNVSWAAASAFCSGRGGLAALEADPMTWDENSSTVAWHEYRQNAGKPAWRRSDGGVSTNVGKTDSRAFIGFRCAR